jgi:WD40 repeat protein
MGQSVCPLSSFSPFPLPPSLLPLLLLSFVCSIACVFRSRLSDPIATLKDATDSVTSVAFTAHQLLAVSVDGRLRTYDIRAGKRITDHIHQSLVSVCVSSDKACVLVGALDSTLRLFDVESGELLNQYTGHTNKSYKVKTRAAAKWAEAEGE